MLDDITQSIQKIRKIKPVILCLTNHVTMDFMANCLLALGAAPIMSEDIVEIKELVKLCHCVNINIGTLHETFNRHAIAATSYAQYYKKPMILDPVGSGATSTRTNVARHLYKHADIIRGNASEILSLGSEVIDSLGVETRHTSHDAEHIAKNLARQHNKVIVISGKQDIIVNPSHVERFDYGSPLMSCITGMGCSLTACIAAVQAVIVNPFHAAKLATMYFSIAGQITHQSTHSPGSFRSKFIDTLYECNQLQLQEHLC